MSDTTASKVNSVLLAVVLAVSSFVAAQVYLMNGMLRETIVRVEAHEKTILVVQSDIAGVKAELARLNLEIVKLQRR